VIVRSSLDFDKNLSILRPRNGNLLDLDRVVHLSGLACGVRQRAVDHRPHLICLPSAFPSTTARIVWLDMMARETKPDGFNRIYNRYNSMALLLSLFCVPSAAVAVAVFLVPVSICIRS
jgi:hypothetical protein